MRQRKAADWGRRRPRALGGFKALSVEGEPEAGCRRAVAAQCVIDSIRGDSSKGMTRGAQKGAEVPRHKQERSKDRGWRVRDKRFEEAKEQVHGMVAAKPSRRGRSLKGT